MEALVLLFVFATMLCFFYALFLLFFEHRYSIKNRLIQAGESVNRYEDQGAQKQTNVLKGQIKKLIQSIEKSNYYAKIKTKLLQAYIKMKPIEFIEISFIAAVTMFAVLFLLTDNGLLAATGFLLGFRLPESIIETIRKKRMKQLNDQLPQALSLVANGLRAGFSFPQAMAVVSREMESPIADEFARVLRDNSFGKNMDEALEDLGKRTDDEDLDIFITTLLIHLQVGGDLSEILDTISETIRERVKLKGDIRTLISQSKMSAWVIGTMPVALGFILFAIRPEYMLIMLNDPIGLVLLGIAGGMILLGAFVLTKIVKIKL